MPDSRTRQWLQMDHLRVYRCWKWTLSTSWHMKNQTKRRHTTTMKSLQTTRLRMQVVTGKTKRLRQRMKKLRSWTTCKLSASTGSSSVPIIGRPRHSMSLTSESRQGERRTN
ncbi:hypothetical protein M758_UG098800 [Ceratodon purpureus]|nr:hypothetical protein M758_UG098800 [Ceratodon purpureus]